MDRKVQQPVAETLVRTPKASARRTAPPPEYPAASAPLELWDALSRAGKRAGEDAARIARESGTGVVYGAPDGAVVERLPDGTVKVLHPARESGE